ncbi:cupin domain-containing protein [Chryseolinea sp. T2]|uniref:cupin domain-containing protein n=1 Tax=Chryseolinea sp. T2 TaxID=3129255 RepID=UPI003076E719
MNRKQFIATGIVALPLVKGTAAGDPKKPFVVAANKNRNDGVSYFHGQNLNNLKISKKDTDGSISMYEYGGIEKIGPPLHVHFKQDEIFYIVEGEYRFVVGNETHVLHEGDSIFLPRNIPHTWLQLSDIGKMIYTLNPAGTFEEFFDKLDAHKGPVSPEEFDKITLAHDMKNVGPPLTL